MIPLKVFLDENPKNLEKIIDNWSTRNYQQRKESGYELFFNSFDKFILVMEGNEVELLSQICLRASKSNISYLESMMSIPSIEANVYKFAKGFNNRIEDKVTEKQLDALFETFNASGIDELAHLYVEKLKDIHQKINKHGIKLKFLTYGLRTNENFGEVFGQLHLAFLTAKLSNEVVGVNFVAPEDDEVALREYDNHMKVFHYLKHKFPSVNIALHAGELVSNLNNLDPKNLTFHITSAIEIGKATRIGHGVSIQYEDNLEKLIKTIKKHNVVVEINLESNQVILNTNPSNHPVNFYLKNNIPIIISTDDEGVLRTSLTNQFVLLTTYAPNITFEKVKSIVYNSIHYSFLSQKEKKQIIDELDNKFIKFAEETNAMSVSESMTNESTL